MRVGYPLYVFDLFGDSKTGLCRLKRPPVFAPRTQVLRLRKECVDFGRLLANLAGNLEALFAHLERFGETDCSRYHCFALLDPSQRAQLRQSGGQSLAIVELAEECQGL